MSRVFLEILLVVEGFQIQILKLISHWSITEGLKENDSNACALKTGHSQFIHFIDVFVENL